MKKTIGVAAKIWLMNNSVLPSVVLFQHFFTSYILFCGDWILHEGSIRAGDNLSGKNRICPRQAGKV